MTKTSKLRISLALRIVSVFTLLVAAFPASPAHAAQMTARKLTLSSSSSASSNATTTYTFNFTPPSSTTVQSFEAQICTTASGTCTTPTGFVNSSSVSVSGMTGTWSGNTATAGSLRASATGASGSPSAATVTFTNVQNPTSNTTFYARLTTYSTATWTTPIDTGTVAASTANQITVSGSVDETLTFCTGTSGITSSSCAGATGTTVTLGSLSPSSTGSGTSQIGVATNAGTGYAVTVAGTTLTSGSNTISALASQTASTQGSSQFGLNLRANTTPSVGSDPAGSGSGAPTANYNTANQYRFVTGDQVASAASADAFRLYTVSYIANISNTTPPGSYSTTLTYVGTATF